MNSLYNIDKINYTKSLQSDTKPVATILIIEHDSSLRFLLEKCLDNGIYQTVSMSDGTAALAILAEMPIDLILLDLTMPNCDGLHICQAIRQQYNIPIVVLSAQSSSRAQQHAKRMGATAYLAKPVRLAELHLCAQSLLANTTS